MALVQCPECAKQISDQAASCPHCGAPRATVKVDATQGVITTQATGKSQKGCGSNRSSPNLTRPNHPTVAIGRWR